MFRNEKLVAGLKSQPKFHSKHWNRVKQWSSHSLQKSSQMHSHPNNSSAPLENDPNHSANALHHTVSQTETAPPSHPSASNFHFHGRRVIMHITQYMRHGNRGRGGRGRESHRVTTVPRGIIAVPALMTHPGCSSSMTDDGGYLL